MFRNLSSFLHDLTYLSLLNSFLFLSRFSVSLKSLDNYFFRWFAYKSLLGRFSVLISYNMGSSNHFYISSRFPCFTRSRFFRVQVFRVRVQGLGPGFRSSPLNSVCESLSSMPLECYKNSLNIYFSWKVFFVMIFFAQELSNGILFSKSSILKNPIEMWHSKNMKTIQKQERASSEQKSDVFHKK